MTDRVLGVDGCRAGWLGIALGRDGPRGYFAPGIRGLAEQVTADGPVAVIAIDIPIGLADRGRRRGDDLARQALGSRWASLFITPVRAALRCDDYRAAGEENRRRAGEGISRQAFALRRKVLEVDGWARQAQPRVVEAHPELSFAELAGAPLAPAKSTWAGTVARRALLARAGIAVPDDLGPAGMRAGPDDVLDAAAAAWTARRVADGIAVCRPDPPEIFSDGIACAIWT